MFKLKETYLLSEANKDKGEITIYNIVSKKHLNIKKRFHKVNVKYRVINFIK